MPSVGFTRDEAILTLDVLYHPEDVPLKDKRNAVADLCAILHDLPIIAIPERPELFRTESGVYNQLQYFSRYARTGIKNKHLGEVFVQVDAEFANRHDELHQIAQAIRRNLSLIRELTFGDPAEAGGFAEGALLGHLHRVIEARDGARITPGERCDICQLAPAAVYPGCPGLLQAHLTVPPTALDGKKRYGEQLFVCVCPTCHAALHRRRPWLTKENRGELLR